MAIRGLQLLCTRNRRVNFPEHNGPYFQVNMPRIEGSQVFCLGAGIQNPRKISNAVKRNALPYVLRIYYKTYSLAKLFVGPFVRFIDAYTVILSFLKRQPQSQYLYSKPPHDEDGRCNEH